MGDQQNPKSSSNQKKKSSLGSKENKFQSTEWAKQWKWQWGWYIEFHWNGIGKELRGKRKKKLNIWRNILLEYILGFIIYLIVEKEKKKRGEGNGNWVLYNWEWTTRVPTQLSFTFSILAFCF